MLHNIIINKQNNTDLEIQQCGYEKCISGHFFGPAVRDFFLLHYVDKGKGIFESGEKKYLIESGGGFLIFPGRLTYYEADAVNPWEYTWVGFEGRKAEELLKKSGLTEKEPVFSDDYAKEFFLNIRSANEKRYPEIFVLAELYSFFSHMSQSAAYTERTADIKEEYIAKAVRLMGNNYVHNLKISGIASQIGLNRSYFYEIFKSQMGVSPQEYLINIRMEKACDLLRHTSLKIRDISRSVGYEDEFMFSRIFSKKMGVSPLKYKKR